MPYTSTDDLPDSVKNNLPQHALDIYKEAFNNAYNEYKNPKDRNSGSDREETAHKVAWSAVKTKYEKKDDGRWGLKE